LASLIDDICTGTHYINKLVGTQELGLLAHPTQCHYIVSVHSEEQISARHSGDFV